MTIHKYHKKKGKKKSSHNTHEDKEDRSEEPRTKFAAERAYVRGKLVPGEGAPEPKPTPKPESEEGGAVAAFGRYLKGVVTGENRRAFEKVFREAWKQRDLKKDIVKSKKKAKIARLKAKGRKLREK